MMVAAIVDEPQDDEEDDNLVAVVGMSSSIISNSMDSKPDEYVTLPPTPETPLAQLFCQCPFCVQNPSECTY